MSAGRRTGASTPSKLAVCKTLGTPKGQGKLKPLLRTRARLINRTDVRISFCAAHTSSPPTFKRAHAAAATQQDGQ